MAPTEGFKVGGRVNISDGRDLVGFNDFAEVLPGRLDRIEVGHVGHAASGSQVGQKDLDFVAGEDIGRFGHEVDAAKHDRPATLAARGELAQLEAVAPKVGEANDLVLLIMVSKNQECVAQRSA